MRRRTLEKLASTLVVPAQTHGHESDDDCLMCRGGGPIASFFPDAAGNPPAAHTREFLVREARKVLKAFPSSEDEIEFISMGVNRGGRFAHAGYTVDREGAIYWTYDGKRTLVTHVDPKPTAN